MTPALRLLIVPLVCLLQLASPASSGTGMAVLIEEYLQPIEAAGKSVLVTECSVRHEGTQGPQDRVKLLMIVPLGGTAAVQGINGPPDWFPHEEEGVMLELWRLEAEGPLDAHVANWSSFAVVNGEIVASVAQGGLGAIRLQKRWIRFLLGRPFRFVESARLMSVLSSEPAVECPSMYWE